MHLVDDRAVQRSPGPLVVAPVKRVIDYGCFRHSPRIVAEIAGQIFARSTDHITKHFVRPIYLAGNGFRIWIDQELRAVETHPTFRIVRAVNSIAVKLPRPDIWKKNVPDLV